MFRRILIMAFCGALCASAQQAEKSTPKLRLNMVNVCTPGEADTSEMQAALSRIPLKPPLAADFEVARGRTSSPGHPVSRWVRLRRDLAGGAFSNVQYLFSREGEALDETLVFHARDAKPGEPVQIALEQQVDSGTAAAVLAANAPPSRIRVERFGKPSLILARCPNADQAKYEPLFRAAAERFSAYRAALKVRTAVSAELARMGKN